MINIDMWYGDYTCNDSVELEKAFPQLTFNWE